jgi:DNA-binding IclR family transcriptional regulator
MSRVSGRGAEPSRPGRSLKTATEALEALRILGSAVEGLSADELAARLDKSTATARYLLNTLCQEGFAFRGPHGGRYLLEASPPWGHPWGVLPGADQDVPDSLADAVSDLYGRTRQRTYLARPADGATWITDARGHQGLARVPGLKERIPHQQAHALAVTKALAALSPSLQHALREECGFTRFTGATITGQDRFDRELAQVRRDGFAVNREEFAPGFCCIAAPITDPTGRVAASLGISMPLRRFASQSTELIHTVVDIAADASRGWRDHTDTNGQRARPLLAGGGEVAATTAEAVGTDGLARNGTHAHV